MRIVFKRAWRTFSRGETANFDQVLGNQLIKSGFAELCEDVGMRPVESAALRTAIPTRSPVKKDSKHGE